MTGNTTKPTIAQLVNALKENHGLVVDASEITTDIYNDATKGYDRGVSLKSMANRCRFYLAGSNKDSEPKETVSARGIFVGSKDIATEKKPLGKNKSQTISFLQECDDGFYRVFNDPNTPSHFKGFKKDLFGALVDVEFTFTKNGTGTYVTPENVTAVDKGFELDTSLVKVYDINALPDLEDFTACAVVGTISSIKSARIPPWEQDNYKDAEGVPLDDFPLTIKGNPVFTMFLQANTEEGEPIVKGVCNPTNIAKPFIVLDDFEAMWPKSPADIGDEDQDDFLQGEITPMYNGVEVILIGQKKRASDYDGNVYVDFDINAIIPVVGEPSVIEVASGAKRAKAAKAAKEDTKKDDAAKEAKKQQLRIEKVAEIVTAMRDATTPQVVRDMAPDAYFVGVDDAAIQSMIDNEFEAQGIGVPEEGIEAPEEPAADDDDIFGEE